MKRYVTLERNQSAIIQNSYACAGCWNRVIVGHDKDGDFISCGTEDCQSVGLVHQTWIEKRKQWHAERARIAKEVLSQSFEWIVVINKRIPMSREISLQQLGF